MRQDDLVVSPTKFIQIPTTIIIEVKVKKKIKDRGQHISNLAVQPSYKLMRSHQLTSAIRQNRNPTLAKSFKMVQLFPTILSALI